MPGRLTLGLYNCYHPKQWHDIMRMTLALAGPVALAFDCDVTAFDFPFAQPRRRGAKETESLATAADIAGFVSQGTSIGEGGEAFQDLVAAGRFTTLPYPKEGAFPARFGQVVATTPGPDAEKLWTPLDAAQGLVAGRSQLLVLGLGPRGLPPEVLAGARHHLELTGKGISLETATALGAIPAL